MKEYPFMLIDCWGHQVPLILVDYQKGNPEVTKVMAECRKFNEEQKDIYKGKTYKALEVTSVKHGDQIIPTVNPKEKAKRKILRCVWNDTWWDKVVITHIEPLAIAVNVTQAWEISKPRSGTGLVFRSYRIVLWSRVRYDNYMQQKAQPIFSSNASLAILALLSKMKILFKQPSEGSCSFSAITHQFEKDAEADSGSKLDDEDTELVKDPCSTTMGQVRV
ncbi:hypothetical protein L208DRAFT_1525317 [Tricholoma matsutake]|nr:hypothetical protein L208DRAFT_1525317 [Tricholoma matsutake 945]